MCVSFTVRNPLIDKHVACELNIRKHNNLHSKGSCKVRWKRFIGIIRR